MYGRYRYYMPYKSNLVYPTLFLHRKVGNRSMSNVQRHSVFHGNTQLKFLSMKLSRIGFIIRSVTFFRIKKSRLRPQHNL